MEKVPFGAYDFFGYVAPGLVVLAGLEWTLGYPHVLHADLKVAAIAVLVLAVYVAGHVVAEPARAVLEDWVARRLLGPPSVNLLSASSPRLAGRLLGSYLVPLPAATQARVKGRASREGCRETGEPLFLHARFHQETLANERLLAKLDRFVSLYGFARNMAFACLAVSIALGVKVAIGRGAPADATRAALLVGAGLLLFVRFLKFYRLYSFELLNNYGSYREGGQ